MLLNRFKHATYIFEDIIIPESQHGKAVAAQAVVPFGIVLTAFRMLTAIELDNQFWGKRDKVGDISFDGLLPTKFQPGKLAVPKMPPKLAFSIGGVVS